MSLKLGVSLSPGVFFQGNRGSAPFLYSALFLKPGNYLQQISIPPGWTRHAHHCTLEFLPKANCFPTTVGSLQVKEIRQTPDVMYALVDPPQEIKDWVAQMGLSPIAWHITIATAPGKKPFMAGKMAELDWAGKSQSQLIQLFDPPLVLPFEPGIETREGTVKVPNP
jgi:hypothetical protein